MSTSNRLDWVKTGSMVVGSIVAVGRAVIEYRKFRRDKEKVDYTRDLQQKAWRQVMDGELSEAKVGDVHVKAATKKKKKKTEHGRKGGNPPHSASPTPGNKGSKSKSTATTPPAAAVQETLSQPEETDGTPPSDEPEKTSDSTRDTPENESPEDTEDRVPESAEDENPEEDSPREDDSERV